MKFGVMKFGALVCALLVTVVSSGARAADDRMITVADVYGFAGRLEVAVNKGSPSETRADLIQLFSQNAQFFENVSRPQYQVAWANAPYAYGYPVYGGYYARPYATYGYVPANYYNLSKGNQIDRILSKKQSIPGYQIKIDVTHIDINPYGSTAVASIDMKEFGSVLNPYYYPMYEQTAVQGNSRCRLYLVKGLDAPAVLTRLDCNTNSNLPL